MRKILSATITAGDPVPNVSPYDGQLEDFFPSMALFGGLVDLLDARMLARFPEGFERPATPLDFFPALLVGKNPRVRVTRTREGGIAKEGIAGRPVRVWFSSWTEEEGEEGYGILFHIARFSGEERQAALDTYGLSDPYDGTTEEEVQQIRDAADFERMIDDLSFVFYPWEAVIPGAQVDEEGR